MAASETVQARRAALLLHGLRPAVRRQVIARLDVADSARLQPLLDELTELGVSQSLGRELQHLASQPHASKSTERTWTVQEQTERLSAEEVVRCLQSCAPETVAQLLRAGPWSWQTRVLNHMPDARRAEVLDCLRNESAALAPAVLASLCERLCLLAAQLHVDRPHASVSFDRIEAKGCRGVLAEVSARLRRSIAWMR